MSRELLEFIKKYNDYEDYRYVDSDFYLKCREYVKLYLLVDELTRFDDDVGVDVILDSVLLKMGILCNEMGSGLLKMGDRDKDFDSVENVDRFNYSFGVGGWAMLKDEMSDFCVRVHEDDVEGLDSLLNGLTSTILNFERANHNLNRRIIHFNELVSRKLSECDDEYICNLLKTLQLEVYI